jgi:DNA ligase-1
MLAHEYSKRSHNIKFPCYAQPKLNGIRNLAKLVDETTVRHSSRGGKIFNTLSHISEEIKKRSMLEPGEIFDGELFSPHLTFQEICAAVKRESEVNPDTLLLEYHVYDFADPTLKFSERLAKLSEKITDDHIIKLVETRLIESEEDLILYHKTNVDRGFEGTMIRNMDGAYVFKNRSSDLQKYKDFLEAEFEIVGGKEGSGKSEGQCVFSCITENGGAFDVRCVGSNEVREEQLINLESYIGKMLTVKYQTLSDDGIPIFPVGITLRDYE